MLTSLQDSVSETLLQDRIPLGHALLIAKLLPAQQEGALKAATRDVWAGGGYRTIAITLRELQGWIAENVASSE